ncbi:hypothetical protein JB92DRAFT_2832029 [Gautieria morchelliformis]|nr:hypothetical protein JB92DRAFT_2832029 [Gautieria morchelliformis]
MIYQLNVRRTGQIVEMDEYTTAVRVADFAVLLAAATNTCWRHWFTSRADAIEGVAVRVRSSMIRGNARAVVGVIASDDWVAGSSWPACYSKTCVWEDVEDVVSSTGVGVSSTGVGILEHTGVKIDATRVCPYTPGPWEKRGMSTSDICLARVTQTQRRLSAIEFTTELISVVDAIFDSSTCPSAHLALVLVQCFNMLQLEFTPRGQGIRTLVFPSSNIIEVGYVDRCRWIRLFNVSKDSQPFRRLAKVDLIFIWWVAFIILVLALVHYPTASIIQRSGEAFIEGLAHDIQRHNYLAKKKSLFFDVPDVIWDIKEKINFWEYMQNNIYSWAKFVEDHGKILSELVLVTGFHKTSYWACEIRSEHGWAQSEDYAALRPQMWWRTKRWVGGKYIYGCDGKGWL